MATTSLFRQLSRRGRGRDISFGIRGLNRYFGSSQLVSPGHDVLCDRHAYPSTDHLKLVDATGTTGSIGEKQSAYYSLWSIFFPLPVRGSGLFDVAPLVKFFKDAKTPLYVPPLMSDMLRGTHCITPETVKNEKERDEEINDWVWMSSTLKKRRAKMNKHKLKKRRKLLRKKAKK